ncbi:MAG: Fur family transcriptional regulator [Chloroflexota bacterium]
MRQGEHRLTPQRVAVLRTLVADEGHLTAEQIYERVRVDFPMTSLATVYKTLAILKEMGEVLELGFSDGSNRYDGKRPRPHPHLICIRCRDVEDVDVATWESLSDSLVRQTGYHILSQRLDFFGICPRCQQQA